MRTRSALMVWFWSILAVGPTSAQQAPRFPANVKFDAQQVFEFVGDVKMEGTFATESNAGLLVVSIKLCCAPYDGGKRTEVDCDWQNGTWKGQITKLPPNKYAIEAAMVTRDAAGKESHWTTGIKKVFVNAPPPVPAPPPGKNGK